MSTDNKQPHPQGTSATAGLANAPAPAPTPPRDVKLRYGALKLSDETRNRWTAMLAPEHTIGDLTRPAFWSLCAKRIETQCIIDVLTEDGRFYGELFVLSRSDTGIKVKILRMYDLHEDLQTISETPEYDVQWMGPAWKYCVLRMPDKAVVAKGMEDKGSAYEWIETQGQQAA